MFLVLGMLKSKILTVHLPSTILAKPYINTRRGSGAVTDQMQVHSVLTSCGVQAECRQGVR